MNLVCPGVGQIVAGRKLLGTLFILFSISAFAAAVCELLIPLALSISSLLSDSSGGTIHQIHTVRILIDFAVIVILYIFSYLELISKR